MAKEMIELSPQEEYIVRIMRELRPFEVVEIVKDQQGRPNSYLIKRSQKIIVNEISIEARKL